MSNSLQSVLIGLGRQQWGLLLGYALLGILPAGLVTLTMEPHERYINWQDPTLLYPHKFDGDLVPASWLGITGALALVLLIVAEAIFIRKRPLLERVWSCVYLTLEYLNAMFLTLTFMLYFKTLVGRYRPDFIDVCQPVDMPQNGLDVMSYCTGDKDEIAGSQTSYPSGHTSTSFSQAFFLSFYLIWIFFIREPARSVDYVPQKKKLKKPSCGVLCLYDLVSVMKIICIVVPPVIAALISVSRIIQYRHHPSDINAGCGLAFICVGLVFLRSVYMLPKVKAMYLNDHLEVDTTTATPDTELSSNKMLQDISLNDMETPKATLDEPASDGAASSS